MKHEYTGQMAQAFLGTPAVISQVEPMKRRRPKDGPETVSDDIGVMVRADGCVLPRSACPRALSGASPKRTSPSGILRLTLSRPSWTGWYWRSEAGSSTRWSTVGPPRASPSSTPPRPPAIPASPDPGTERRRHSAPPFPYQSERRYSE